MKPLYFQKFNETPIFSKMSNIDEFTYLLEGDSNVNILKLRDLSYFGIPDDLRNNVWKILLNIVNNANNENINNEEMETYDIGFDVTLNCIEHAKMVQKSYNLPPGSDLIIEKVILKYLNSHSNINYNVHLVYAACPFVKCMNDPYDIELCYNELMNRINMFDVYGKRMLALFSSIFPIRQPELYNHFDEEMVDSFWIVGWLKYLLCKELPLDCLIRLFDTYFSIIKWEDVIVLHVFVCLSLIDNFKEQLMEIETPQYAFLEKLPSVDMDKILIEANNIKEDSDINWFNEYPI